MPMRARHSIDESKLELFALWADGVYESTVGLLAMIGIVKFLNGAPAAIKCGGTSWWGEVAGWHLGLSVGGAWLPSGRRGTRDSKHV